MGVHRPHPCGVDRGIEQRGIPAGGVVAAVERRAAAPAAAACELPVDLDNEVRPVVDQLRVQAHDRATRLDLGVVEEPLLQLGDRRAHQRQQQRDVIPGGEATGQGHGGANVALPSPAVRVLVCRCTIGYAGRLTTRLASGDRVVLFKEDGSVAVHALKGAKPINYMAGPTSVREEDAVIRIYRPASDETLTIVVEQVHRDERHALTDTALLEREGQERELHEHLARAPHLIEAGLAVVERERLTDVGPSICGAATPTAGSRSSRSNACVRLPRRSIRSCATASRRCAIRRSERSARSSSHPISRPRRR